MKKLLLMLSLLLTGCSYSINQVHTEGSASDVVDDTASNTPTANVSIPKLPM